MIKLKLKLLFILTGLLFAKNSSSQCNPMIPPNVSVVSGTFQNVGQGSWFFWICADSIYAGGGSNSFYLESGVLYTGGSGSNIIWVPPGAHVNIKGGGSNTIYYVCPESIINPGNSPKLIKCPAIHYDYTYAPANGCPHTSDTASCPVQVLAGFNSSDTAFCEEGGKCIDFFDQSTGGATSWQWLFPGATPDTSTQQNPTSICYYSPGTYAVKQIVSNGGVFDTMEVSSLIVFGSGALAPAITQSGDTLFCSHAVSYQWYYNGLPIPGATDSFYVANQDGNYNVYITDDIGCSRLGSDYVFTGINDFVNEGSFEIYPNPAGKEFVIRIREFSEDAVIVISNTLGEKIRDYKLQTINYELKVNVSTLTPGVYFINIQTEKNNHVTRFIKQ